MSIIPGWAWLIGSVLAIGLFSIWAELRQIFSLLKTTRGQLAPVIIKATEHAGDEWAAERGRRVMTGKQSI
jgi:hypothetical protein